MGVYNGMIKKWGPNFHQKVLMSGGSAGTIFALALALGKPVSFTDMLYSNVAVNTLKKSPIYYGSYYLEQQIRQILKDPLVYKKIEGRWAAEFLVVANMSLWLIVLFICVILP